MNAATIDAFLAKHDASLVISRAWAHLEAGSPAASLSTNVPAPRRAEIALRGYCLLQRGLGSDWAEAVAAATRVSVARSAPSSPPPPPPPPLPQAAAAAAAVAASEESDALTPEQLAVCGEFILERARALRSDFAAASAAAAASAGDATSAASGELTARQRTCMAQAEALIASAASSVSFFPNALYD